MARWQRMALMALAVSAASWVQAAGELKTEAPATSPAVQTTKITLDLKDASPEEAFDQLGRQAGLELMVDGGGVWERAEPVTLSVKEAPFWPTFLEVCKQANVSINNYHDSSHPRSLHLTSGENNPVASLPCSASGGFVALAQSANRSYHVSYDNPKSAGSNLFIQLTILCDPALRVQQIASPSVTEAVDENGLSLRSPGQNHMSFGSNPGFLQQAGVGLSTPPNCGKKIAVLKGTLRATVMTKTEDITIEDPLSLKAPVKKSMPDFDVTIGPLKKQAEAGEYVLKVVFTPRTGTKAGGVRRGRGTDYESLFSSMELSDAQGRRMTYSDSDGGGGRSASYDVTLSASGDEVGPPTKLSWKPPVATQEMQVPFEFKNLPIP